MTFRGRGFIIVLDRSIFFIGTFLTPAKVTCNVKKVKVYTRTMQPKASAVIALTNRTRILVIQSSKENWSVQMRYLCGELSWCCTQNKPKYRRFQGLSLVRQMYYGQSLQTHDALEILRSMARLHTGSIRYPRYQYRYVLVHGLNIHGPTSYPLKSLVANIESPVSTCLLLVARCKRLTAIQPMTALIWHIIAITLVISSC